MGLLALLEQGDLADALVPPCRVIAGCWARAASFLLQGALSRVQTGCSIARANHTTLPLRPSRPVSPLSAAHLPPDAQDSAATHFRGGACGFSCSCVLQAPATLRGSRAAKRHIAGKAALLRMKCTRVHTYVCILSRALASRLRVGLLTERRVLCQGERPRHLTAVLQARYEVCMRGVRREQAGGRVQACRGT